MRDFASAWPEREIVQRPLPNLPWGQIAVLLDKVRDPKTRLWYAKLKAVPFDPAFVGQLNVYLSAADDLLRHPDDQPTIGLLLCCEKNRVVVEYALRDLKKPIGVAGWETKLVEKLPKALAGSLPTVEEIEAELSGTSRRKVKESRREP
jgi:hypothetical protein